MGTYVPTITPSTSNAVSIYGDGATTYDELVNSMGSFLYEIKEIYLKANSNDQLLQPLRFYQFDANGRVDNYSQIVTVDPYQYQTSTVFKLIKDEVILNGRTTLNMELLPNESVSLVMYVNEISNKDFVTKTDMFSDDFFKEYTNFL
jgi:hypothetical protein